MPSSICIHPSLGSDMSSLGMALLTNPTEQQTQQRATAGSAAKPGGPAVCKGPGAVAPPEIAVQTTNRALQGHGPLSCTLQGRTAQRRQLSKAFAGEESNWGRDLNGLTRSRYKKSSSDLRTFTRQEWHERIRTGWQAITVTGSRRRTTSHIDPLQQTTVPLSTWRGRQGQIQAASLPGRSCGERGRPKTSESG